MRGATRLINDRHFFRLISIHAPHAGCDFSVFNTLSKDKGISIHAPHAGCDFEDAHTAELFTLFQSTHPMRGATPIIQRLRKRRTISIHAPHAGCDNSACWRHATQSIFQSTHPMRGATSGATPRSSSCPHFNPRTPCGVRRELAAIVDRDAGISIHAPHAGCDSMVKIFRFYRRFQRHFREAENLPCTYRGFSQFFLLLASPSRYRIIVSLGS